MDKGFMKTIDKHFEICSKNLLNNQFAVDILESKEDVIPFLESVIENGSSVGVGGSITLDQCNIVKWLEKKEDIDYIDRYNTDDRHKAMQGHLTCNVYITSSNAVLLSGGLYNVDGTGNRVSALTYGPDKVYVIVGYNKIVSDLDAAIERVERHAAVANNFRLNKDNPCTKTGKCVLCNTPSTICNTYVYTRRCYAKDRIHVVLVKESLGY
ncbi:MAG TPA: lactate utilization protein [Erysipelotrichaceae bacterium]|nr:LUD domain-containing protein [Erysipelotrichaceae bacterium]HCY05997.1 lactate utilization protein [Erysipelotrichaceae bacterium]